MHIHWLYPFMAPCHATILVAAGCSQGSSRPISICWNALGLKEATLNDTVHTSTFQSIFSAVLSPTICSVVHQQPSCCPAPFWPPERSCRVKLSIYGQTDFRTKASFSDDVGCFYRPGKANLFFSLQPSLISELHEKNCSSSHAFSNFRTFKKVCEIFWRWYGTKLLHHATREFSREETHLSHEMMRHCVSPNFQWSPSLQISIAYTGLATLHNLASHLLSLFVIIRFLQLIKRLVKLWICNLPADAALISSVL